MLFVMQNAECKMQNVGWTPSTPFLNRSIFVLKSTLVARKYILIDSNLTTLRSNISHTKYISHLCNKYIAQTKFVYRLLIRVTYNAVRRTLDFAHQCKTSLMQSTSLRSNFTCEANFTIHKSPAEYIQKIKNFINLGTWLSLVERLLWALSPTAAGGGYREDEMA